MHLVGSNIVGDHRVTAVAPPGKAGTTVSITLETLESAKNGKGFTKAVKRAIFKYAK